MTRRFTQAIVRTPSPSMISGLTSATLGEPDFHLALAQHQAYVAALRSCGLKVTVLEPLDAYPDSCFVEDPALCTPHCGIITRPGAPSRRGEAALIKAAVGFFYDFLEQIDAPGTLEAGDVMMVGSHYYIGLSDRTNQAGADQLIAHLGRHGMTGSVVPMREMLHLKTGVSYLENNTMLVCGEFAASPTFSAFNCIEIPIEEAYAANSVWVNDKILTPSGFSKTHQLLREAGFDLIELEMSEFQKLDGGLSCLSLRF